MTDENQTPVEQETPRQQEVIDWEARYKGASVKINELVEAKKTLEAQLALHASEKEQLKTQLSVKDVEKDTSIGEYKKQLEKTLSEKTEAEKELSRLKALEAKIKVVQELNAPHLMKIIDKIPYVEDPDAMKTIIQDFANWGDEIAKNREKEILAGVTPSIGSMNSPAPEPQTAAEWEVKINNTPIGPDKEKLWDSYFKWGLEHGNRR